MLNACQTFEVAYAHSFNRQMENAKVIMPFFFKI